MMKHFYSKLSLLLALLLSAASFADDLPDLGDSSATVLSPLQEQRIAEQIMRDVYRSTDDVVQDPEVNDYVQALGNKLAASAPDKQQQFKFFVVKDSTINAFAMPGGVIGVHTGLIIAANNESEVAGVLGHEIGHVVQHHMARMLAQQKQDSIISMATIALAILAARASPQLGSGALTAATAGGVQKQLDYTREHEREADRVGMKIIADAGFDTHAMGTFFETLQKGSRFSEGAAPAFLRTHPLTSERIADVRGREGNANYKLIPYSPDFDYIRAKLIASLGTPKQAIEVFQGNIQQRRFTSEAAQHYGLAEAYVRNMDWQGAHNELDWLKKNANPHVYFASLAASIETARNRPDLAGPLLAAGLQDYPGSRALIFAYAEHFLKLGQTDKALKLLAEKHSMYPDDPNFYQLSAKAYAMQGKRLLSFQAQGESYMRQYNLQGAIEQMELATKAGDGDFYQQSIVEARLNQLKALVVEPTKF